MKKLNWQKVNPHNISRNCFWINGQSKLDDTAVKDLFDALTENFSLPNKKTSKDPTEKSKTGMRVLHSNAAQNLMITLRGLFKNSSHEQIKHFILRCDTSVLNAIVIEGLIKFLPERQVMKQLEDMIKNGVELSNIEKFVGNLGEIERLVPHLQCINFKINYNEMVEDLEPDIRAGSAACKEVISSKMFGGIISLILRIGNHLNSGSNLGGAIGFDLAVLTKLEDVKCSNTQKSLLHYIVQAVETKYPELLFFDQELVHVEKAARLSVQAVEETIQKLTESSKLLQNELINTNYPQFVKAMSVFSMQSRQQLEELTILLNQMKNEYQTLANYYAFDVSKLPMEECFFIIKTFTDSFAKERKQSSPQQQRVEIISVPERKQSSPEQQRAGMILVPKRFKCKVQLKRWSNEEFDNVIQPKRRRNDSNDEHTSKKSRALKF